MGITGATVNIASQTMNIISSIFSRGTNVASYMSALSLSKIVLWIINLLSAFFYFVCKWLLFIVDVIFSYVQQLAGLNMNFNSLQSLVSKDSDIVFNLLFSNSNMVTKIIRDLIVIALVLIIVFSIFAVIKTQFDSVKNGKAESSLKVLKSTFKAILLLILTPMLAIFGIITSNLILQALYMATNTGRSSSLGTQVFLAAATPANNYRNYAIKGKRIPITFNFEKENEIYSQYDSNITEDFVQYLTSTDNAIYSTYLTFSNDTFLNYESLKDTKSSTENEVKKIYYSLYDVPETAQLNAVGKNGVYMDYRRIDNYAVEYYVMADVVEYAVSSSNELYFKTIEDTLNSIVEVYRYAQNLEDEAQSQQAKNTVLTIFNNVVSKYGITFLNASSEEIVAGRGTDFENYIDVFTDRTCRIIRYSSTFVEPNSDGEPEIVNQIQYNHIKGETDELFGAKFIMAVENTVNIGGVSYKYFEPLSSDYYGNSKFPFSTQYHINGVIPAKGIFESGEYPTAIRKGLNNSIEFYREKLVISALGSTSDFASMDWTMGGGGVLSGVLTMIQALFNPASIMPNLHLDSSFSESIRNSYSEEVHVEKSIEAGRMHIGYLFNGSLTSWATNDLYNMSLGNVFQPYNINYFLLVFGAFLLIITCFKAMMALIQRAYDLFLIIIFYPTACATIPLENVGVAGGYKNWADTYMRKLFSTYGVILGINFVLMLFPVIQGIQFFSPQNVAENKAVLRIGNLFFGLLSINQMTTLLNSVTCILFELVAFSFLKSVPTIITKIVGGEELDGDSVIKRSIAAVKNFAKYAQVLIPSNLIYTVASKAIKIGHKVGDIKRNGGISGMVKRMLPMNNAIEQFKNQAYLQRKRSAQKAAKDELDYAMKNGASTEEVEQKLKEFRQAQKEYTEALQNAERDSAAEGKGGHSLANARNAQRKLDKKEESLNEKTGVSSRDNDDLDDNNLNVSYMSNRKLRKKSNEAKRYLKALDKAERRGGGLTEEQEKARETYTKIVEATAVERGKRKQYQKDKREIENLRSKGNLTAEELKRIQEFDDNSLLGNKRERKHLDREQNRNARHARRERERENNKAKKENAKNEETERVFASKGKGRKQRSILRKMDKQSSELLSRTNQEGLNVRFTDISKMDSSRINDVIQNPQRYGVSAEQVKLMQDYQNAVDTKNKNAISEKLQKTGFSVTINDAFNLNQNEIAEVIQNPEKYGLSDGQVNNLKQFNEITNRERRLVDINRQSRINRSVSQNRLKKVKDNRIAGYRGINIFKRVKKSYVTHKSNSVEEMQKRIAEIDETLSQAGYDAQSYKTNIKLIKEKADLQAQIDRAKNWNQNNNREFRRDYKRKRKYGRRAVRHLEYNDEAVTPENIDRVVDAYERSYRNKKGKRKKK